MSRSKVWMFTLNNPEDVFAPMEFIQEDEFIVWQLEQGASGTPHLQGYVEFKNKKRLASVKKLCARAHWEQRRGTQDQAVEYVTKDDTRVDGPWSYGTQQQPGQRTDLELLRDMMKNGDSLETIKDANFGLYCRTKYALDTEYQQIRAERMRDSVLQVYDDVEWKKWQWEIVDLVKTVPDKRTVHWYYEGFGNVGKSFLTTYLQAKGAYVVTGGKVCDIAYAYDYQDVVIFDISRTKADTMDHLYEVMEMLKNGNMFSTKYQSVTKVFSPPHVIVFANFHPDMSKLSQDRWHIVTICA